MSNPLPRRYPEGDGLDDLSDRDLRDLAWEYDVIPAKKPDPNPPGNIHRDPPEGYIPYLDENGYLPSYADRVWMITKLREHGAKNPYIAMARQEAFSDDDIVTVDSEGRIIVVREGGGSYA